MTYVLDASALLCFLLGQPGDEQVEQLLEQSQRGEVDTCISALNYGEVTGKLIQSQPSLDTEWLTNQFKLRNLRIVPLNVEAAMRASRLKVELKLGYADAICLELALGLPAAVFVTADNDFRAATHLVQIIFLGGRV